jgi:predicted RNase H-like HicB family nuclease
MDSSRYPVQVSWSEADNCFVALCPQLEGCISHGDSKLEAVENVEHAISEWLLAAKDLGWTVPTPKEALVS